MSETPRCCVTGSLVLSAANETRICKALLDRWDNIRHEQGWISPGNYRPKSYLHERFTAQRRYEYDFSDRRTLDGVFSMENLTLNPVKDFIDQHANRAEQDLLGGNEWFSVNPEGPEDQDPALKLFERYLEHRAELTGLRDTLKTGGIKGAITRGDTIYKCTDKTIAIRDTKQVRLVMSPNNSGGQDPVKDTKGEFVTELDIWGPVPTDPSKQMLLRDPGVTMASKDAAGQPVTPLLSITTHPVVVQSNPTRGCELSLPYFADVGFPVTDPNIRTTDTLGHIFDLAPDDLADMLAPNLRTPAFSRYYETLLSGTASMLLSDEATEILRRGEERRQISGDDLAFAPRRYVEIWARIDISEPGTPALLRRREDIMMLIDYDLKYPVAYDYRYKVCPWIKDRRNPFGVIRINPLEKRATGMGYYRELADQADFVDAQHNRVSIAIGSSGNQFFEDRTATTNRQAGKPLRFRSLDLNNLNAGRTAEEALSVVTIPCEIKEIVGERDNMMSAMQARKGVITPASAEGDGLPAANTLGGMQILEKVSDVGVKQVEAHLMGGDTEGITAALRDFVEVEAFAYDPLAATQIFQSLADAQQKAVQNQAAAAALGQVPPPLDPAMVPADNVALLGQWIANNPDNIRNRVSVVLAPKNSSQIVNESQQSIQVGSQWNTFGMQFGPEQQQAWKPVFVRILSQLGEPNPDAILKPTQPPPQPQQPPAPNGQPAAPAPTPAAGPGQGGPAVVTPPPQPLSGAEGPTGL